MPDRHAQTPISIRPPKDDRAWLEAYARVTGRPVRAILAAALAEYRAQRTASDDPRLTARVRSVSTASEDAGSKP